MEAVVTIADVRTFETRGGNVRYVVRDTDGKEYTTFREEIGNRAKQLEGSRERIAYHEEQRGEYTNVYLDKVEPAPSEGGSSAGADTDPKEAAWQTAVEAAPWLVGESEPHEEVPPDKLYDKLKPFQERVAEDIERREEPKPPSNAQRAGTDAARFLWTRSRRTLPMRIRWGWSPTEMLATCSSFL